MLSHGSGAYRVSCVRMRSDEMINVIKLLYGMFGGDVRHGSSIPDSISDQNMYFSSSLFHSFRRGL